MRKLKYLVIAGILIASGTASLAQLNVITYNIRYNNPGDGEHAWPYRKADVINLLKFHDADIFCLQEALEEQVMQVDSAFRDFTYVGVGRDDGKTAGEYSPVFYNTKRFKKIREGNFWLAEDPGKPALGWDASHIRICTWVQLKEIESGKQMMVFNTHFDHMGDIARSRSADLVLEQIEALAGGRPVILTGDFNLAPDTEPIKRISAKLNDSRAISQLPPHGAVGTLSGFVTTKKPVRRIDYIFVSDQFKVKRYGALTDSRDGSFFSDHLPVLAELELD